MTSNFGRVGGLLAVLAMSVAGAACRKPEPPPVPDLSLPTAGRVGLADAERSEFYHLDEGSEVFPAAWFIALESETGQGLFAQNLERFGFLPDPAGPSNPMGLPVGLTAADTRDLRDLGVKMIGVNCAACHVSEAVINGKRIRLDGAGGRADISMFYGALAKATVATATSPQKFLAFLKRLGGSGPVTGLSERDAKRAETAIGALAEAGRRESASPFDQALEGQLLEALDQEMKRPTEPLPGSLVLKPGATQVSAAKTLRTQVGRDLSDAAMARRVPRGESAESSVLGSRVGADEVGPSVVALFRDSITKLRLFKARVEFLARLASANEQATPPGFGRIDAFGGARNLLFAEHRRPSDAPVSYPHLYNFERITWLHWDANTTSVLERNIGQALGLGAVLDRGTFTSTVSVVNLHRLEQLAKKITPPRWQDTVGPIDEGAAERGAALFGTHCASCHASGSEIELDKVGTDPRRARNFAAPVGDVPNDRAIGDLITKIKQKAFDDKGFTEDQRRLLNGNVEAEWRVTSRYAARPLIATWATAPYLHNNSVPTLADLLLPPERRPAQFFVGASEYDVQRLGFVTTERPGSFLFDTKAPGNSNSGHTYGTGLSDPERASLLEYLKKF